MKLSTYLIVFAFAALLVPCGVLAQDEAADTEASAGNTEGADFVQASTPAPPESVLPKPVLPREVHAGTMKTVETTDMPVEWVDLDTMLLEGHFEPETDVPSDAISRRSPDDGMCYVIVTVMLKDGRSISRYDYRLRAGGTLSPCLALSIAGRPFDVRQWRYALPGEVRMLFECPRDAAKADLEFALNTAIPQATVAGLPLREEPEAAANDSSPTSASEPESEAKPIAQSPETGPKPDAAGTEKTETKPEVKPEAKPEAKPETPEPAPKPPPKKEEPKGGGALLF